MITRIEATNYRCFDQLNLDLGRFGVLVGANGSGKSTLLDIPVLLGDLLRTRSIGSAFLGQMPQRLAPRAASFGELVHKGLGESFIFAIEAKLPEGVVAEMLRGASKSVQSNRENWPSHLRYELRLQIFNKRDIQVQNEYLFSFAQQYRPPRGEDGAAPRLCGEVVARKEWGFIIHREYGGDTSLRVETKAKAKPRATSLSPDLLGLPKVGFESREEFPAARWFLDLLTLETLLYRPDFEGLRQASPPGLATRLLPNGLNLPWLALGLKNADPNLFDTWKEHVRLALPQVSDIDIVEREEDHHAYFRITYANEYTVTSSGLSDGTLRILALTLPAYLVKPPALLIAEEPENGIHPRAIEVVLDALSSIGESQVLVSSHSPVVVTHVDLQHLIAARLGRAGSAEMVPGPKHPRMVDWKGSVGLGTLFAAGVLG